MIMSKTRSICVDDTCLRSCSAVGSSMCLGGLEMMRRSLLAALLILVVTAAMVGLSPGAAADALANAADPVVFMNEMWNRTLQILSKQISPAVRQARFRELFQADFDGPGIARFVLGRYWRKASEEEQQE